MKDHSLLRSMFTKGMAPALILGLLASAHQAQGQRQRQQAPGPRIPPLESSQSPLNLIKTLSQHPDLMKAWGPFGGYVLNGSSLPARDRELLILRTAFINGAQYEWGYHSRAAKGLGVTDEELAGIIKGPEAQSWSSFDRALMRAADELNRSATISDRTWAYIDARYDEKQLMDLVFTVGQYKMVSMALGAFRIQMDEGLTGFPTSE